MSRPSRRPHPAIVEAREAIALEQDAEDAKLRRIYKAVMVAPTLTVCRALLHGERIPFSRLDLAAVNRYGLREIQCTDCGKAPNRITVDEINDVPDHVPSRLPRWPAGHLELVTSRSSSPAGRPPPQLKSVSAGNRQSREEG